MSGSIGCNKLDLHENFIDPNHTIDRYKGVTITEDASGYSVGLETHAPAVILKEF